jgi:hypothetical protein
MNIIGALRNEEAKLQRELKGIQGAIAALNGTKKLSVLQGRTSSPNGMRVKRTMSAAVRAKLSRKAKERWAKFRVAQGKKAK